MLINRIAIMFLIISILYMIYGNVLYNNNYLPECPNIALTILLFAPPLILWLINKSKTIFKHKYFQLFINIIVVIFIVFCVYWYLGAYIFFIMIKGLYVNSLDDSEVTIKKEIISEPNFATYIFKGERIPKKIEK